MLTFLPTNQIREALHYLSDLVTVNRLMAVLTKKTDNDSGWSTLLGQDSTVLVLSSLRGSLVFLSSHLPDDYLTPADLHALLNKDETTNWEETFRMMRRHNLSLRELAGLISDIREVIYDELKKKNLIDVSTFHFLSYFFDWILQRAFSSDSHQETSAYRSLNSPAIDYLRPIVESVHSPVDLHPVLQMIVESVQNSGIWPMCAIGMTDADDQEIIVPAQAGFLENYPQDIKFPALGSATLEALRRMRPIAINDVLVDTEFPVLQGAAKAGGYRSILLVPFKVEEIKAVVTFGSSQAHEFTQDEILLANAIAKQVMIAIENAYHYEHEKQRVEELESLNRMIGEQNRLLQRVAETHTALTKLVLDDAGIDGIIKEIRSLLGNPVAVENENFQLLGYSADWEHFDLHRRMSIEAGGTTPEVFDNPETAKILADLRKNRRAVMVPTLVALGIEKRRIVCPIIAGGDIMGYVWVMESLRAFDEQDLITAEQAALVLALEMVKQREAYETELRLKADFVDDLLSKQTSNEAELFQRASYLGISLAKLSLLFIIECRWAEMEHQMISGEQYIKREIAQRVQHRVNQYSNENLITLISNRLLIIVQLPNVVASPSQVGYTLAEDIHQELKRIDPTMKVLIGLGGVSKDIEEVREAYIQAQNAIDAAKNLDRLDEIVSLHDLGVYGILYRRDDHGELQAFAEDSLRSLIEYDRRNGTELMKTLGSYLTHQGKLTDTADELYIHVNTLRQRIERIEDILEVQINDPFRRLNLELAVKIYEAMNNNRSNRDIPSSSSW